MNLQARIKGFVALGHQLSDPNNTLLNEAKLEAYRQNAWFLPEFIDQAILQIREQFLDQSALEAWITAYPSIPNEATNLKVGLSWLAISPWLDFMIY